MPIYNLSNFNSTDNVRLLVWELTESIVELQSQLFEIDKKELETRVSDKRKLEFVGVRVALKALLGKEVCIKYDENGKPFLKDGSFHISVSHSGRWIVVMAHSNRFVGVDIEIPTDKIQKLAPRFLGAAEQVELSDCLNMKQLQLAWSAKEALYKIIGNEAVDFAKQLRIFPFEVKSHGEIMAEHSPKKKQFKLQYIQLPEFTLVYCLD